MKKNNLYYLLLLIVSISFASLVCFHLEPDTFWHVKAGEYMLHHGILRHDIFSWAVVSKYWMSHEWLFEVILASLKSIFGTIHVYIYCFVFILSLFLICFLPNQKEWGKNIPYGLLYLLFFSLILVPYVQARPHMISFVLLAFTIWFLSDFSKNKESKKIWFLPIISVLWSNVHGGSSNLVYLLCFLFGVGGMFSFQYKKIEAKRLSKKQIRTYFLVMFLCMIAVCINPHGFKMFLYPYQNMMDTTMLNNIKEWQATSLSIPIHYLYYAFLVFLILTMLFSEKKIQFMDFLILGFTAYLGLKSVRFWVFTSIIMCFYSFYYVKSRKQDRGTSLCIWFIAVCLLTLFAWNVPRMKNLKYQFFLRDDLYPILKKEQPKRLFNMYDFGGELIYHDFNVFIDGRADYYSPYNYEDYLDISKLQGDYVSLIQKYDFDYFLVSKDFPISTYIKYNDQYEEIYHHGKVLLYKKIVN